MGLEISCAIDQRLYLLAQLRKAMIFLSYGPRDFLRY
jgi:hypothetical protein